jgi:serine/threonine protein kinase
MKPDNILVDENFDLVIADFGFAAPDNGRDGKGVLYSNLGTEAYKAPEIHNA